MKSLNKSLLKKVGITIVVLSVIIGILGIWGILESDSARKSFYTCAVLLISTMIITGIDGIFTTQSIDQTEYSISTILKTIAIIAIFLLCLIAILSIRNLVGEDVQRKSYSTIGLIFAGSVVGGILERNFSKKQ